jgi:hypothetical protein
MNKPIATPNVTQKPGGEGATPGFEPIGLKIEANETLSEDVTQKPGGEGATPGSRGGSGTRS